jgi:chromatin assembly factor 1 subunit B
MPHPVPPSSTSSSVDPVPPTPGSESEKDYTFGGFNQSGGSISRESGSSVTAGLGLGLEDNKKEEGKRGGESGDEAPKKKRRVALTHLGDE